MTRLSLVALLCLMTSAGLLGCGQTGPLYLPNDDGKVVIKPTANE
ncbi:MAG: LPS translocon maturation chaperone LptM [Steroidobacteraceae bacterium]